MTNETGYDLFKYHQQNCPLVRIDAGHCNCTDTDSPDDLDRLISIRTARNSEFPKLIEEALVRRRQNKQ